MIYERLGGDVGVDGLGVLDLTDQFVFESADDKGVTAAFGGLVQLEISPNLFVDGIGAGVDNGSGVI